ncbi:unnamed protein product, partial [Ectocarpus sp. 13 AM-2016]
MDCKQSAPCDVLLANLVRIKSTLQGQNSGPEVGAVNAALRSPWFLLLPLALQSKSSTFLDEDFARNVRQTKPLLDLLRITLRCLSFYPPCAIVAYSNLSPYCSLDTASSFRSISRRCYMLLFSRHGSCRSCLPVHSHHSVRDDVQH